MRRTLIPVLAAAACLVSLGSPASARTVDDSNPEYIEASQTDKTGDVDGKVTAAQAKRLDATNVEVQSDRLDDQAFFQITTVKKFKTGDFPVFLHVVTLQAGADSFTVAYDPVTAKTRFFTEDKEVKCDGWIVDTGASLGAVMRVPFVCFGDGDFSNTTVTAGTLAEKKNGADIGDDGIKPIKGVNFTHYDG